MAAGIGDGELIVGVEFFSRVRFHDDRFAVSANILAIVVERKFGVISRGDS